MVLDVGILDKLRVALPRHLLQLALLLQYALVALVQLVGLVLGMRPVDAARCAC